MLIHPSKILPSQDFLKENTVRYIFKCIETGNTKDLPPTPIIRKDQYGRLVAIDGHNLIAVKLFLNEDIDVIIADSPEPILQSNTEANEARNTELRNKFYSVLDEQKKVEDNGIQSFEDLIRKYPELFVN